MFSILVPSTKKWYSSFLKKNFVFQKICFKVKVLKTLKIPNDCHIKTCRSLKRRAILKSLVPFFRRTCALSVGFRMERLKKKRFPVLRQKFNSNFAVKLAERSSHSLQGCHCHLKSQVPDIPDIILTFWTKNF